MMENNEKEQLHICTRMILNLQEACRELIQQVEISDFRDENGLRMKMNESYDRLKGLVKNEN